MDKDEAQAIAATQLRGLRAKPYRELRARLLDRAETGEVLGPSGVTYQIERQAVIDGPADTLRVMVSVDDGRLRAFTPVTVDFLVSPQGTFIDE